ncbi:MAG: hypothetical protein ABI833_12985, partial [Acidobacteriota bacterium]
MSPAAAYTRTAHSSRLLLGLLSRRNATLLSLLVVYIAIVLIGSSATFDGGDEGGYVAYAMRIVHVPATEDLRLWWGTQDLRFWWGPGYPLVLAPFAAFGWPWLAAKLLNAFFIIGAIAYVGAVVSRYCGSTWMTVTLC